MQHNMTPKMHLLLAHASDLLKLRQGVACTGESKIERAHQIQHQDNLIASSCGNTMLRNGVKQKRKCIRNNI